MSNICHVHRIVSSTCFISHKCSWQKSFSWKCAYEIIVVKSYIKDVHPLYLPTFPFIVFLKKHKSMCSLEIMSRPKIILYLWLPRESSNWKFHAIIYFVSNFGSKISTLLWCFVWNFPPWVFEVTSAVYFRHIFLMFVQFYIGFFSGV